MRQCVMRRLISVALGIVMIILAGCSFSVPVREEESTDSTVVIKADQKEDTEQARETEIYVHVCGCVKKPGVYRLHFGARTQEAIDAAGGFSEKANQTAWNLAEVLQDGMQVYIPSKDEAKEEKGSFTSIEGIKDAAGIGDGIFNRIKDLITVN